MKNLDLISSLQKESEVAENSNVKKNNIYIIKYS